jgi:hypothetical protein
MKREELLERQYQMLRCLVAGGPAPEGIPSRRLLLVSRGLAKKRQREAISSWPGLEARLGDEVFALFEQYADAQQRPKGGSPLLDGYQFSWWLAARRVPIGMQIVTQCRPFRQSIEARPFWQRWALRLSFLLPAKSCAPVPGRVAVPAFGRPASQLSGS